MVIEELMKLAVKKAQRHWHRAVIAEVGLPTIAHKHSTLEMVRPREKYQENLKQPRYLPPESDWPLVVNCIPLVVADPPTMTDYILLAVPDQPMLADYSCPDYPMEAMVARQRSYT